MQTEEKEQVCGIFTVQGVKDKKKVKIIHVQNIPLKESEYIADTLLSSYDISDSVKGEIYLCNITHVFLMSSIKLPMLYVSVIYERPLRSVLLFRIYLCFNIETKVQSAEQLLNRSLNGNFSLEICIESQRKEIDNKLEKYPGDEKIIEKLKNFTMTDVMKELNENLIGDANQQLKSEYSKEFEYDELPKATISLKDYYSH
jgi:hypothetical protein